MIPRTNSIDIFLLPGKFYFAEAPLCIQTLLGSCVAITMWHPQRRIGGMCHYMLPSREVRGHQLNGKYADETMRMFEQEAQRYNTKLQEYQIKLFGGGSMFTYPHSQQRHINIAKNNVAMAHKLLDKYGLQFTAQDLGRSGYRNVIFDLSSGDVWVKHRTLMER